MLTTGIRIKAATTTIITIMKIKHPANLPRHRLLWLETQTLDRRGKMRLRLGMTG
jgi:hypothetical protein